MGPLQRGAHFKEITVETTKTIVSGFLLVGVLSQTFAYIGLLILAGVSTSPRLSRGAEKLVMSEKFSLESCHRQPYMQSFMQRVHVFSLSLVKWNMVYLTYQEFLQVSAEISTEIFHFRVSIMAVQTKRETSNI